MVPGTFDPGSGSFDLGFSVVSPVTPTPHGVAAQDALKHVLHHVLCLPEDSGICLSLKAEGFVKIGQVIGMSASTMRALSYKAKVACTVPSVCHLLQTLQGFAHFHAAHIWHTLTPGDWLMVTNDMFDAYCQGLFQQNFGSLPVTRPSSTGNLVPTAGHIIQSSTSLAPVLKRKKNWGGWQQHNLVTNMPPSPYTHVAPVHESYLDSNMGSDHNDVDHPGMTSSPEVLVEDPVPDEDHYSPALQNMMSLNCTHGESQENTNHGARQDTTSCVTFCEPTDYAFEHERKVDESLVCHGTNGGLSGKEMAVIQPPSPGIVHVEEGIHKHQVCDIPMVTTSDVFSKTSNNKVVGSTNTWCILTDNSVDISLDISNVTTTTMHSKAQDWDPSVLDCDPHGALQSPDDPDATEEEHVIHDNFNKYGEFMDRYLVAPVVSYAPSLEGIVLDSTMMSRHVDIVKEADKPFLGDENHPEVYNYIVVDVDDLSKAILHPAEFMQLLIDKYKFKLGDTDDLAKAILRPAEFTQLIIDKYKFKLRGTGPINFQGKEDVLCLKLLMHSNCMLANCKQMYGEKPSVKVTSSILEKNNHLELDDLELCALDRSVVGSPKWIVSLGRNDITTAAMTLSEFRSMPRKGHLLCTNCVVAYVLKIMCDPGNCIRTHELDYSGIPLVEHVLATSIYGELVELVPSNLPCPNDKPVTLTLFVEANLYHDWWDTGHSVKDIQCPINVTPIGWYSKYQSTVETTYGSEFTAACTCVEQVIDLHNVLHYLGVPIHGSTLMFGDNKPVVDNLAQPHAKWHMRHTALSSHLVRGAITAGFYHIPRKGMTWGYQKVWQLLQPQLFWHGDLVDIARHCPGPAKD